MSKYYILDVNNPNFQEMLDTLIQSYSSAGGELGPIFSQDSSQVIVQVKDQFSIGTAISDNARSAGDAVWARNQVITNNNFNLGVNLLASEQYRQYRQGALTFGELQTNLQNEFEMTGKTLLGFSAGTNSSSIDITGQDLIQDTSIVNAWVIAETTIDHSVDEHVIENIMVKAGNIIPGVGFTIYGINTDPTGKTLLTGTFRVGWSWR